MNKAFDRITVNKNEVEIIVETSCEDKFYITLSDPSSQYTFHTTRQQLELALEGIKDLEYYNDCMHQTALAASRYKAAHIPTNTYTDPKPIQPD